MNKRDKLLRYGAVITIVIAAASALYSWYNPRSVPGETHYREVRVPRAYAVISKQTVTVEVVKVITKTEIREKWPDWFKTNDNLQLTAIGLVEPYRGRTECASIIDLGTGESRIVTKQLPVPLLGFENRKAIGALTNGSGFMVHGSWTFARVGNFYPSIGGGFIANRGDSTGIVGAGVTYVW